jgi:hypothetical protein
LGFGYREQPIACAGIDRDGARRHELDAIDVLAFAHLEDCATASEHHLHVAAVLGGDHHVAALADPKHRGDEVLATCPDESATEGFGDERWAEIGIVGLAALLIGAFVGPLVHGGLGVLGVDAFLGSHRRQP